jgi:histidinol-phosphate aminotransferase
MRPRDVGGQALRHHGDADAMPGLVDLAVNVRANTPPTWLRAVLADAMVDLARYPDGTAARHAVARRHGREPDEVLLTAGAAEAFVLLARGIGASHATVIHPQFTEPESAALAAGLPVHRSVLRWPFHLGDVHVPPESDLVFVGNPTNPTSVGHPIDALLRLARPGRVLVVDEAFADCVSGEPSSLSGRRDVPGLVVLRSLTKTWGLAGLRCGYLLADPTLVGKLAAVQQLWPLSTPALAACVACSSPSAVAESTGAATALTKDRAYLLAALADIGEVDAVPDPVASFVLLRHGGGAGLRVRLAERGFAVRRGDTFPGLGADWIRIAVRAPAVSAAFCAALADAL